MKVYYNLDEIPQFNRAVLTIGAFDGVHHGHRQILKRVLDTAKEIQGTPVVLTFSPHPRKVVFPKDGSLELITTLNEKISLLEACGIEHLIVAPFTVEFSQINPHDYVEKILIQKISPEYLIIGYDHRFGMNRQGNIDLLKVYAKKGHFNITEIPEREIDSLKISSTRIRKHLKNGAISLANKLLGEPFRLSGIIIHGKKVAGGLGFPTANIRIEDTDKIIPRPGTYAATALLNDDHYEGMLYIGQRKTLGVDTELSIEINLFHHFDTPFYDREITTFLHHFIRSDEHFKSKDILLQNIQFDQKEAKTYFQCQHDISETKVTVAILNWNGMNLLREYLPSVVKFSSAETQILLIDNNSDDRSLEFMDSSFPQIGISQNTYNQGFAEGYNQGLLNVSSKYVVLLNNDVRVTPGWIDPLLEFMEHNPNVAAVQPKIKSITDEDQFEYAGASGGFLDALGYPFCRGRIFNDLERDQGQYDEIAEVFWTSGAAMMIRTEVFMKCGGFDGDFFAHQEEIDLCWRLHSMGFSFYCLPESVVYHLGASTLSKENPHKTFLNFRNNWWMLLKNEHIGRLLWIAPARVILDLAFMCKLMIEGQWKNAIAIPRACAAVVSRLPEVARKRKKERTVRRRMSVGPANRAGRTDLLLPLSAYIFGKKTFRQLVK